MLPVSANEEERHKQEEGPANGQMLDERNHRRYGPSHKHQKDADLPLSANLDRRHADDRAREDVHGDKPQPGPGRNRGDTDRESSKDRDDPNDPTQRGGYPNTSRCLRGLSRWIHGLRRSWRSHDNVPPPSNGPRLSCGVLVKNQIPLRCAVSFKRLLGAAARAAPASIDWLRPKRHYGNEECPKHPSDQPSRAPRIELRGGNRPDLRQGNRHLLPRQLSAAQPSERVPVQSGVVKPSRVTN